MIFAVLLLPIYNETRAEDASQPADLSTELKKLDLSQLMDIEVISVSKKLEKLSRAPAAIFVITQEDIRRSGATSLPELLRIAPATPNKLFGRASSACSAPPRKTLTL